MPAAIVGQRGLTFTSQRSDTIQPIILQVCVELFGISGQQWGVLNSSLNSYAYKAMNKIRDIQKKIHAILDRYPPGTIEPPLYIQTYGWLAYAKEYRRAAIAVSGDMHLVCPMLNLTGHAIECALKGFLSASGATPPVSHDLVNLLEMCHSHGLQPLPDLQIASLIWVSHYYHQDLVSKTKYKARFPTRTDEMVGGPIPSSDVCSVVVESVCDQTKHKLKLAGLWSESTTADDPGDA